ncbi:hypothetical protein B0H14DRAFT_3569744 [Mycena olivaceomarginata]|nr:hypothetical protein B0H14DRAFT_3569744 [Mycena olivaceomarginata]
MALYKGFSDSCSPQVIFGAHVASRPRYCAGAGIGASEDRYCVEEWAMLDGTWTFAAVFDGHSGSAAADFVRKTLPPLLKTSLSASLAAATHLDDKKASHSALDEDIPVKLSASEGHVRPEVLRAESGTTVSIALIDPFKAIHVDWFELAIPNSILPFHKYIAIIKTPRHINQRVYFPWRRRFRAAYPELVDHNLTPPYLSNVPEILPRAFQSVQTAGEKKFLVIASDGLCDLAERIHRNKGTPEKSLLAQPWGAVASAARQNGKNMAVKVFWDAFSGDGGDNRFQEVLDDKFVGRVDDTTIIVVPL